MIKKLNRLDRLKKRLKENINGLGIWGIKTFIYLCLQKWIQKKVIYVKSKMTGKERLYLRTHDTDIMCANFLLGEKSEYAFLLYMPEVRSAKTIIDAGANIGIFTRICRSVNPDAQYIAIEAEKKNFEVLKMNCVADRTICINKGLWNKESKLKLIERNTGSLGFMCKEVESNEKYDIDAISVSNIFLLYGLQHIDVFKIDIEGSEYYVFDDTSEEWIDKVDIYIIEFHDRIIDGCSERVMSKLFEHGYDYFIRGENYVFSKKI